MWLCCQEDLLFVVEVFLRRLSHTVRPPRKKQKLLLLSFDWTRPKDPPLSLGQASLLAKLNQEKVPVVHNAWSVNHESFRVEQAIDFAMSHADEGVDLAMGAYVWHEPHTQKLLKSLKKAGFPGDIILGGPQISYTKKPGELEQHYPEADVFIRGYGEDALTRLWLSDEEKPPIAGVHYAGEPDLGLSASVDLDNLPSPYLSGVIKPQRFIRWETQRGCPFKCAFCQHRESDVSMVRRQLDFSRVMQETQWMLDNPVIQDVAVLDPTFNSGPHYLDILHKLADGGYSGKLALQCRVEMVKEDFLEAVTALNRTAQVVLEFGLQTIHRDEAKLIQRPNNMRKVTRILTETRKRNIATEVSLIFGLPGQTLSSFAESIQYCKNLSVPTIYAFPLMLLRGTPLHAAKEQLQLVESSDLDLKIDRVQENIPHVVASPSFTQADWNAMAKLAEELDEYNASPTETPSKKMQATLNSASFWKNPLNKKANIHGESKQSSVIHLTT